ncbi:MAG: response regulator [Patescibacteria group bacterium]|jgi:CheY-like chemotaxis protein
MDKVLVIDDDPQFTDIVKFHLQKLGIEVYVAHTKNDVFDLANQHKFKVIILDIFFPNKEDSQALLKLIKKDELIKNVPIVLVTSLPMEFFQQEGNLDQYLRDVKMFVSKNEDAKTIVSRIKDIITDQNQPSL